MQTFTLTINERDYNQLQLEIHFLNSSCTERFFSKNEEIKDAECLKIVYLFFQLTCSKSEILETQIFLF